MTSSRHRLHRGRHRPQPRRSVPRHLPVVLLILGLVAAAGGALWIGLPGRAGGAARDAGPTTPATATLQAPTSQDQAQRLPFPAAALRPGTVRLPSAGFVSWALLDRTSGQISGSPNLTRPGDTMSMVKAWIAADYLRQVRPGETPSPARLDLLTRMIRDSDNEAAEAVYRLVGGRASIERMVRICRLTDSQPYGNGWSKTVVSARDTVRMGQCLADGDAAGARWTGWLLGEMRQVRGTGDFGVRLALPPDVARTVAIKNGWLLRDEDGLWHIACLAIGADWVLGVLARYPGALGFEYGTRLCRTVGEQLLTQP